MYWNKYIIIKAVFFEKTVSGLYFVAMSRAESHCAFVIFLDGYIDTYISTHRQTYIDTCIRTFIQTYIHIYIDTYIDKQIHRYIDTS